MKNKLKFDTGHNQFYLTSDDMENLTSDAISHQAFDDRLGMVPNTTVVYTECYGPVKGELTIIESPPVSSNFSSYDHVVEGALSIGSGILKVVDCPFNTTELELKVNPGNYRVRVYSSNLASVVGDEGNDYYKIEMWPSDDMERRVLKRYERIQPDEN